ncbi:MAG TPA: hypothetical protein PLY93_15355, partial [Turneriella sp.]|nr:hypothetical protein [Turneriella sp.]
MTIERKKICIQTPDHWEIALYRYASTALPKKRPEDGRGTDSSTRFGSAVGEITELHHGTLPKRKYPVLLLHGIASNHKVWDFGVPEFSFARHLASQGYIVYSMDL